MGKEELIDKIIAQINKNEEVLDISEGLDPTWSELKKSNELLKDIKLVFQFVVL